MMKHKRPNDSQIVRVTENQVESWWALLHISTRPQLTRRFKLYVMFCCALLGVLSNFAIILKKKRELFAFLFLFVLWMSCYCECSVALPHDAVGSVVCSV